MNIWKLFSPFWGALFNVCVFIVLVIQPFIIFVLSEMGFKKKFSTGDFFLLITMFTYDLVMSNIFCIFAQLNNFRRMYVD